MLVTLVTLVRSFTDSRSHCSGHWSEHGRRISHVSAGQDMCVCTARLTGTGSAGTGTVSHTAQATSFYLDNLNLSVLGWPANTLAKTTTETADIHRQPPLESGPALLLIISTPNTSPGVGRATGWCGAQTSGQRLGDPAGHYQGHTVISSRQHMRNFSYPLSLSLSLSLGCGVSVDQTIAVQCDCIVGSVM